MVLLVTWLVVLYAIAKVDATYRTAPKFCKPDTTIPISVAAHFDLNGIRGNVTFHQKDSNSPIFISAVIDGLDQFGEDERWGWHVHNFPINHALLHEFPCSLPIVGGHFDPDNRRSNENYTTDCSPETPQLCELGDFSGRFGRLLPNRSIYQFQYDEPGFNLYEHDSFVGRSIVIHRTDGFRYSCANIEYDGHNTINTLLATFPKNPKQQQNTLQGDIILRQATKRPGIAIYGEVFRVDGGPVDTSYNWNLRQGTCDDITDTTPIYGTFSSEPHKSQKNCSRSEQRACITGNLTGKCGPLVSDSDGRIQTFCTDTQLSYIDISLDSTSDRFTGLSLVVEEEGDGSILACTCFGPVSPIVARATLERRDWRLVGRREKTVHEKVDFYLHQSDPNDPTYGKLYTNYILPGSYLQIRSGDCTNLGPVFEPRLYRTEALPEVDGLIQTGDRDFIGDLRNKVPLTGTGIIRSNYLPLFGRNSVVGRPLVLNDVNGAVLNCMIIKAERESIGRESFSQHFNP